MVQLTFFLLPYAAAGIWIQVSQSSTSLRDICKDPLLAELPRLVHSKASNRMLYWLGSGFLTVVHSKASNFRSANSRFGRNSWHRRQQFHRDGGLLSILVSKQITKKSSQQVSIKQHQLKSFGKKTSDNDLAFFSTSQKFLFPSKMWKPLWPENV